MDSQCEVLLWVAAVPEQPRPQLHPDDAEDEENEEAEEEHVTQHGQRVEQQVHQDTHACSDTQDEWKHSVNMLSAVFKSRQIGLYTDRWSVH